MIQSVDNSSAQASSAGKAPTANANGGTSFATALASAQSGSGDSSSQHGTITGGLQTDLVPPKGETWGPVDGHTDYADILSGARNGFFVSLTGPRKGQAFEIVHHGGKTFHVYGEGAHKKSIEVPPNPADLKPLKGETWNPVEHHKDYKKISGGKRTDQFVNLSGNARTGETFKIAHHDGKTWHVYASGREVAVGGHRKGQQPAAAPAPTTPSPTTGNPSLPG
jgi:hypothetical protein